MKFIRNHTNGPWFVVNAGPHWNNTKIDNFTICYGNDGEHIVDHVYGYENSQLMSSSPEMLDYMIERANKIHDDIKKYVMRDDDGTILFIPGFFRYDEATDELFRVMSIIKKAGVEVVE